MELAKILVNETSGTCILRKRIPAGIVGATVGVEFAHPVWDGLRKTVIFRGNKALMAEFDGKTAVIPAETVETAGDPLFFGIWGHDPDTGLQLPLIEVRIGQIEAATDPNADPGTDPSLPIWAELEQRVDQLEENPTGGAFYVTVTGANGEYTADATLSEIAEALEKGSTVSCVLTATENDYHAVNIRIPLVLAENGVAAFSLTAEGISWTAAITDDFIEVMCLRMASYEDIPTALPNPKKLTFQGAVTGEYDGSKPVTIHIPEGGSGNGSEFFTVTLVTSDDGTGNFIPDKSSDEIYAAWNAGAMVRCVVDLDGESVVLHPVVIRQTDAVFTAAMYDLEDDRHTFGIVSIWVKGSTVEFVGTETQEQLETDSTLTVKDGVLSVNTTNDVEQDNTLPITSAGVFATVGNIEALLKTI